jgi:hypothetical protein
MGIGFLRAEQFLRKKVRLGFKIVKKLGVFIGQFHKARHAQPINPR